MGLGPVFDVPIQKYSNLFSETTWPRQQAFLEAFVHHIHIKLRDFSRISAIKAIQKTKGKIRKSWKSVLSH